MDEQFKNDLTQEVALIVFSKGITNQPVLRFLYNDAGVFEWLCDSELNNFALNSLKSNEDLYLQYLGCHAFGVGLYLILSQNIFGKSIEDYGFEEIKRIVNDFSNTDPYELALITSGIGTNTQNKKVIDQLIVQSRIAAKRIAGNNVMKQEYLKEYMKCMFNAGVTLVLR